MDLVSVFMTVLHTFSFSFVGNATVIVIRFLYPLQYMCHGLILY